MSLGATFRCFWDYFLLRIELNSGWYWVTEQLCGSSGYLFRSFSGNKEFRVSLSLRAESDSQLPPTGEPVGVVSSAEDEDEARGDQGADSEDQGATGTGQEGVGPSGGSAGLS